MRTDNAVSRRMFGSRLSIINLVVWLILLGFLWATLIRQLALEWSLNPQYAYGWAVPGLCVLLLVRDIRGKAAQSVFVKDTERLTFKTVPGLVLVLIGYGLTRLIQEANPDWRLVNWLMTIEVVGFTSLVWPVVTSWALPVFPLLFVLVAVPWPTLIEAPLIHGLTSAIASGVTEILGLVDIPALHRGDLIEVSSGVIGIEEACSGIRSLQAAFMIALFFGHWYRLRPGRRLACVGAGCALAFACNLVRTTLLTLVAVERGPTAMAKWHDTTTVFILLACFGGIWFVAGCFRNPMEDRLCKSPAACGKELYRAAISEWIRHACAYNPSGEAKCGPRVYRDSILLLGVALSLGLIEFSARAWYGVREARLPRPLTWHIVAPTQKTGFRLLSLSPATRRILRADEATNVSWVDDNNFRWQALFLHWKAGGVAAWLARNHTPADCLPAAGKELLEQFQLQLVPVKGLDLPFRAYRARDENGMIHVFYCLWEDRSWCRKFDADWLSYRQRLAAVLAGQRNSGQRSLELAVWGPGTEQEAEAALGSVLNQLICLED